MGANRDKGRPNPIGMSKPGSENGGDSSTASSPIKSEPLPPYDPETYRGIPADQLNNPYYTLQKKRQPSMPRRQLGRLDDDAPFGCD